jgi:hypothetical protein
MRAEDVRMAFAAIVAALKFEICDLCYAHN